MKDSNFLPPALLGKGDIFNATPHSYPEVEVIPGVKEMYCIQLGFHFYSFIHQMFMRRSEKKYWEFVLHHTLTLFLILYSYCTNLVNLGTLVLFLHDISDVALSFSRAYAYLKIKNSHFSTFTYVFSLALWIYTRCYVLPMYGIRPTYYQFSIMDEKYQ